MGFLSFRYKSYTAVKLLCNRLQRRATFLLLYHLNGLA